MSHTRNKPNIEDSPIEGPDSPSPKSTPSSFIDQSIRYIGIVYYFIYGFVAGLIAAPFIAIPNALSQERQTTPRAVLSDTLKFLQELLNIPFTMASDKADEYTSRSDDNKGTSTKKSLGHILFYGSLGFIAGLVVAPLAALTYILNNKGDAKDKEAFLFKLLSAPVRFVKVLLATPFLMAKDYAVDSKSSDIYRQGRDHSGATVELTFKEFSNISQELTEVFKLPAEVRLVAYLKLAFYGLTGFILGVIESPIKAIQFCINGSISKNSKEYFSFLWVVFLPVVMVFFVMVNPFIKMSLWMERSLKETQDNHAWTINKETAANSYKEEELKADYKINLPLISYLRVGLYWLVDLAVAFIIAPFIAIRNILTQDPKKFADNYEEGLLAAIVKAPFRFVATVLTYPWNRAKLTWEKEKTLEQNRVNEIAERFDDINRRELNTFSEYTTGFLRATLGLIIGLISLPVVALYHLGKSALVVNNEHLVESLLKLPLRLLDVITFPLETARNFAKPLHSQAASTSHIQNQLSDQSKSSQYCRPLCELVWVTDKAYEGYVTEYVARQQAEKLETIHRDPEDQSFDAPEYNKPINNIDVSKGKKSSTPRVAVANAQAKNENEFDDAHQHSQLSNP